MTYADKLKDPRWQKKRLEILERDDFTCQLCKNEMENMHVHHRLYIYGLEPWEYDNDVLISLCEYCHYKETKFLKDNIKMLIETLRKKYFSYDIFWLNKIFNDIEIKKHSAYTMTAITLFLEHNIDYVFDWYEKLRKSNFKYINEEDNE